MSTEPTEAAVADTPATESQNGEQQIDGAALIEELTAMLGEKDQQLAMARLTVRSQRTIIEGLRKELVAKNARSGGTSSMAG